MKPIDKNQRFIGKQPIKTGHVWYSYNEATKELKPAEFEEIKSPDGQARKRLTIEDGCRYLGSTSRRSAVNKLNKLGLKVKREDEK